MVSRTNVILFIKATDNGIQQHQSIPKFQRKLNFKNRGYWYYTTTTTTTGNNSIALGCSLNNPAFISSSLWDLKLTFALVPTLLLCGYIYQGTYFHGVACFICSYSCILKLLVSLCVSCWNICFSDLYTHRMVEWLLFAWKKKCMKKMVITYYIFNIYEECLSLCIYTIIWIRGRYRIWMTLL